MPPGHCSRCRAKGLVCADVAGHEKGETSTKYFCCEDCAACCEILSVPHSALLHANRRSRRRRWWCAAHLAPVSTYHPISLSLASPTPAEKQLCPVCDSNLALTTFWPITLTLHHALPPLFRSFHCPILIPFSLRCAYFSSLFAVNPLPDSFDTIGCLHHLPSYHSLNHLPRRPALATPLYLSGLHDSPACINSARSNVFPI